MIKIKTGQGLNKSVFVKSKLTKSNEEPFLKGTSYESVGQEANAINGFFEETNLNRGFVWHQNEHRKIRTNDTG
jgi:hypothetical protein